MIHYAVAPIEQSPATRAQRERQAVDRLIRRIAGDDAVLSHTPDGAPVIEGSDLQISVSHSRRYAAVAWSENEDLFGIDIEEPRENQLRRIASRFLTQPELDFYSSFPHGLLKAWTLKEAAFKALRTGSPDLRLYRLPLSTDETFITAPRPMETVVSGWAVPDILWLSVVRVVS